ncbi:MAG TPA: hypothetical protein DEA90_03055 [Opitutae bacterium]|nr:hypothetical protein [Puniceicoccaceae bacterium]HBR93123.1 hypothetical protein [Opitutae bacterium]|tara:strand:+ start:1924 stop:2325 length:402 start_codon:yes stop_codon:yes gene_type:complete
MSEVHTLVDFGICVILWLVQCIIYPSFLHMEGASMIDWHKTYVFRFTWIIAPLMILQLICAAWAVWAFGTVLSWLVLILVMTCWGLSFFVSVPLHRQIDQGDPTQIKRRRLIWTNWPRTLLWTAIFVLGQSIC